VSGDRTQRADRGQLHQALVHSRDGTGDHGSFSPASTIFPTIHLDHPVREMELAVVMRHDNDGLPIGSHSMHKFVVETFPKLRILPGNPLAEHVDRPVLIAMLRAKPSVCAVPSSAALQ
jgi:hypothetical protein